MSKKLRNTLWLKDWERGPPLVDFRGFIFVSTYTFKI